MQQLNNGEIMFLISNRFQFSKMNFLLSALLLLLSCSVISNAQQTERNFIGGSFGISGFNIKDEHSSPLIFGSIGIAPALQYYYKGETSLHQFEAAYFEDYLTSQADNFNANNKRGKVKYSYFYQVTDFSIFEKEIRFFLGGSLVTFLSHTEYYFYYAPKNSNGKGSESWYWSNSADISMQLEYNPTERQSLSFQINIPVLSNISRPKYSPSGDYNYTENDWKFRMFGKTEFFPENFSVNSQIVYQAPLAGDFNYQLNYEFYYSFYNRPQDVKMYMNNLRAGVFYCF